MADAILCDICDEFSDSATSFRIVRRDPFASRGDPTELDACSARCVAEYARRQDFSIIDAPISAGSPSTFGDVRMALRFVANSLALIDDLSDPIDRGLLEDACRRIDRVIGELTQWVAESGTDDDLDDDLEPDTDD